ncbi:MAG: hypothetical protein WA667_13995 [Candidatus Nitrosopolaris sp.]
MTQKDLCKTGLSTAKIEKISLRLLIANDRKLTTLEIENALMALDSSMIRVFRLAIPWRMMCMNANYRQLLLS